MHLLGQAQIVLPAWEPDMGWRVLDPDGHVVDAGGKTIITWSSSRRSAELFGTDGDQGAAARHRAGAINGSDRQHADRPTSSTR